jgi:uncharacterized protein YqhQ
MAEKKKYNYGGQAVIEGVMIRGRSSAVTAVRRPNGEITTDVKPLPSVYTSWARRTPLIRGVIVLIEAMVLGVNSLLHSANISMEAEGEDIPKSAIGVMMAISAALVIVLFFIAPLFLTNLVKSHTANPLVFAIVEGVIRLAIFIGYLKVIGMMSDIKRVFSYHGAEHKTVNAYEAGVPMEVNSIKNYSRAHVRCGTSFLFLVLIIAIIVFTFVGYFLSEMGWKALWITVLSRIVLIPVIMSFGYEVIYFGAKHTKNWLVKIILAPGLWLQSMTTGEPDDKQLEVAIAAINKAVEVDLAEEAARNPQPGLSSAA